MLDKNDLVSVVTPSYNQAHFIEDTLKSVMVQDYPRIEHWVIDGESGDGTVEFLKRFEENASTVEGYEFHWISEPDRGQTHALNKGFDRATGEIIGWLNSDDMYYTRGTISAMVESFQQFPEPVLYGDDVLVDTENRLLRVDRKPPFSRSRLLRSCFICQPALFFRREVLDDHRLDESLDYVMDYEFWLRLSETFDFRHVDLIVAADRNHANRKIIQDRGALRAERDILQQRFIESWSDAAAEGELRAKLRSAWDRLRGLSEMAKAPRRGDLSFELKSDNPIARTYRQLFSKNKDLV